jgi:ligand-binding sensor domain-containing protein/serine phosphatase RsbU (regulator of sigma subunit)
MCKFFNSILFIFLFSFFVKKTQAQTYPFSNYGVETGISQGQILSVIQNDDGSMWFGTNGGGITKYNGQAYEFLTDKDGLADNVVFCMAKDKNGRILIGTNNGLSVYDPKKIHTAKSKKFKTYTQENGLSDNRIFSILIEENGNALIGTARGISTFKDSTCGIFKIDEKLDSSSVFHLFKDDKKQLWFSTLGNGVFNYNGKSTKNYTTKDGLQNDMIFSVLQVNPTTFWFFTGEGLIELNDQKIQQINPANIGTSATYYTYYKDKNNSLWIGTSEGLIKTGSDGKVLVFKKKNGLVDNSIWKIFQDKESNLWFASDQNGVSKLASERFFMYTTKDGLLFDEVKKVYQNKLGEYWIGSKQGVSVYKDKKTTNFTNKELLGNADVWAITEDKKGNYLIGTGNGLLIYNGKTFKRIICKDVESQMNTIFEIFVDAKGEIWLGTQVGIAKIVDGYIVPFNDVAITKNYVNKIFQDNEGSFWFGTDDGLFKYSGSSVKHFTEKDGITQKRICTIIADNKNNLYFASSSGLYKYSQNKFTTITDKQGLASNEVNSIVIDKKGNLWAGLSNGIDKIIEQNGNYKIRHYGAENGFIGQECSQNCMIIDDNGQLVVGTSKGLMVYQEKYDKENTLEPITKLKSIDLFFQETDWSYYSDSVNNNNIPNNLELPYDKNYLTFNFIGVSLTTPDKVTYKYMLKGIDTDWRFSSKTETSYSNIPPGKYEFLVLANNGEGVWNKTPVVFKFTIAPPFWRTWWFYSIILIIIFSGIYSYFKIRGANKKILKQNEIIEEKNSALQFANLEIAEKNQNITDSINYAKRIQQSFLTSEKIINKILKEHFILFKPRDIVSGDFYLAFDLPDRTIIVCADCTGHGIPGAFMSLIGVSLLNEISRSKAILDTSKILEELRSKIIEALNPDKSETGGKDGMDISLISIFKESKNNEVKINFSGANNSMYLVSDNNGSIKMSEVRGDKQPVGYYSNMKPFNQHEVTAKKGDIIYLFTDGYADQFGGSKGKKFMSKQLKEQITSIYNMPLTEQKIYLDNAFRNWHGNLEQVDDVTLIGIKLT